MIDYALVLADLATKRAAAVNLFDQVSYGLRLLVSTGPAPTEAAPPKLITAKKPQRPAAKVHRSAATPKATTAAETDLLKGIIAREGLRAAATATWISYQTLYCRARREGWKVANCNGKRPKAAAPAPKPAPKRPAGETVPSYRCESCQLTTQRDPCEFCGKRMRRA